jgi:hypothetical protein
MELTLDGLPIAPPEDVKQLMASIYLDFGDIPPEYLVPAGDGEYDASLLGDQHADPDAVWQGTYHEEGARFYSEWDMGRQHYRKNWCVMREKDVVPVYDNFHRETLDKHAGLVKHLRKAFEAMRDENRLLKRQSWGDDVDIDALVEAIADARDGSEMSDRLFVRQHRAERNIAVAFMVDMSGSTKGWINEAEREALVLLCEALERLGDRYAIYGFLRHHPQALRTVPRQDLRRALQRRGEGAHLRHPRPGIHAHGLRHPPPHRPAEGRGGAHQGAGHPVRRPPGRLLRRLSRPVRHRGHAHGADRGAPGRRAPRSASTIWTGKPAGLPAPHVRAPPATSSCDDVKEPALQGARRPVGIYRSADASMRASAWRPAAWRNGRSAASWWRAAICPWAFCPSETWYVCSGKASILKVSGLPR